mmetsp:Transcript_10252/g.30854  ORF Transcript_10252/g.30854 Transcript_10252/m.30854 type:complete len:462 (-) Transcript_10252:63-1448(-)
MSWEPRHVALTAAASAAAGATLYALLQKRRIFKNEGALTTEDQRARRCGVVGRWTKPVVIVPPGLEELGHALSKRLGCEEFSAEHGPTVLRETFKSGDPNLKFNWQRVVGRKIIFLFDTVDQSRLFEQLSLLQALQGFAVPDSEDKDTKWKTYVDQGKYSWGRASHITVVLPWYRPCQMERTSRWHLADGKWTNGNPEGQWLDVPTAQYLARLLSTPGSVPPLPGPADSVDGMPISPLWRPPLELLFIELHEEVPIRHSVSDLGATIRMERFVPYFLDKFKAAPTYPGKADTYVLFPDNGAFNRYNASVVQRLKLDYDHILYIKKARVGESIAQEQRLFYEQGVDENGEKKIGEKKAFQARNHVLIIDDFTNSGGTLFGAAGLVQKLVEGEGMPSVSIFVSHLVATYSEGVVKDLLAKLHGLGPQCRFFTTNTIPTTTDLIKTDPQVKVYDISDFVADLVL